MKFIQDADKKLEVNVPDCMVEALIKNITGWRTPTKKYKTILQRFNRTGTAQHDYVIKKFMKFTEMKEIK